ncbi:MAG: sensor histidine kinase [Candidatus Dojkabacteria bacterium]
MKNINKTLKSNEEEFSYDQLSEIIPEALHDLNNAVSNLNYYITEEDEFNGGPKSGEGLGSSAVEINQIIGNLYSELNGNICKEEFHVCDVIKEAVSVIEPKAKNFGVQVNFSCIKLQGKLFGQKALFYRMIANLLHNSFKAVMSRPLDSRHIDVFVGLDERIQGKKRLELVIRDSGVGIDPSEVKQLQRAFDSRGQYTINKRLDGSESGRGTRVIARALREFGAKAMINSIQDSYTKVRILIPT